MRVRKLLALTLAMVLVLGSFTFAFGQDEIYDLSMQSGDDPNTFYHSATFDGTFWEVFRPTSSSGTGVFKPFLRVQGNDTEKGYNTDGDIDEDFDTKTGTWTHSITLSEIPFNPDSSDVGYSGREFLIDINEKTRHPTMTVNEYQWWLTRKPDLTGYAPTGSGINLQWSDEEEDPVWVGEIDWDFAKDEPIDRAIIMDYNVNTGSGKADYRIIIPDHYFQSALARYNDREGYPTLTEETAYMVLYVEHEGTDSGFEEWGVRDLETTQYTITIDKTVTGNMADGTDEFEFDIINSSKTVVDKVTATGDVNGTSIPLNPGVYTVREKDPTLYTLTSDNDLVVDITQGSQTVQFTNDYTVIPQHKIIIDKTVTGNRALGTDEFTFEIKDGQGSVVDTVTATGNTDGTSILLDEGTYTVTELSPSPYTLTSANDKVVELYGGDKTVEFTNNYTIQSGQYQIIIDKTVTGNMADGDDQFTFEIKDGQGSVVDTVTATGNTNGMSIPLDIGTYTVTELDSDNYKLESDNNKEVTLTDKNETVTFTNDYSRFDITVYKDVIGPNTDAEFTVSLVTDEVYQELIEEPNDGFNGPPPEGSPEGVISEGNPHTFTDLEPGTYWILEDPNMQGFIFQQDTRVILTDQDEEITFTNYQEPSISIEKTVDDSSAQVGEEVTYTISVTNTGGFDLPEVVLEDEQLVFTETFSLDMGETKTFTETTAYSEEGTIVNTAVATDDVAVVDGEGGIEVMDPDILGDFEVDVLGVFNLEVSDSATVVVTDEPVDDNYSMTIDKTVDDSSVYVNEDVTYTISVTNNGNIDLEYVWVTDELLDFEEMIDLLEVGETETFTLTTSYSTTGERVNTAVAEYGIETEGYMMVEDSATVDVNRRPTRTNTYRMTIDKEADGDFYEVGDTIEYTITVENTGNTTLTNIEVIDEMTVLEETIDSLSPGETEEFETTYVAQQSDVGDLTNTATAEDDRAGTEEATEIVTVEDIPEGVPGTYELEIEKTAVVEGDIFSGDMVEFTIVVTNTGDEILENILVEDDMVDFEAVIDQLEPGESEEFTVMVEAPDIPGPFTNTATASNTETGTVEADDTVFVEEPIPLDVPDTGVAPTDLFFGLGVLVSGLGVFFTKKRK